MLHLLPQAKSTLSNWLGIIGLDVRPYRWLVSNDEQQGWRGEFTVDYLARGGNLDIDRNHFRMERRQTGLRETSFTLRAAGGPQVASAVQRTRGLMIRETTMHLAAVAFTLSGGSGSFTLVGADGHTTGSLRIEREGWTVRQSHGRLNFDKQFGEAVQVFLFWLALYRDLDRGDGG
jgi:hypothetical protein